MGLIPLCLGILITENRHLCLKENQLDCLWKLKTTSTNLLANLEQQIGYIQDKCIHFTVGFLWSVASVAAICGTMTQKLCHDSRMCSNIAASAGEGFMTTPK